MSSKRTEGRGAKTSFGDTGKGTSKSYLPFIIIGGVLAVAVAAGLYLFRSPKQPAGPTGLYTAPGTTNTSRPAPAATLPGAPRTSGSPLPGAQPARFKGDANAPVTIEEFGDFECPPCAALHPELKAIQSEFGPRVRVVFRHYPLPQIHKHAIAAARAAEAAGRQNRFWEMHDLLYQNQNVWKNDADVGMRFADYARTLGLNVEQFKTDMNAPAVMERVTADHARGGSLGVTGTPTLFLNGRELSPKDMTPAALRAQIQAALNSAGNTR